ncbi:hypothetical protein IDH44_10315 [Paenibacillus sp. IB182496]|uniref:Uncharacterized protein n=1 Tax=Paenibacillus sabuli TaxID=2772509 RepID=A0A927BU58_9BACL|nr:hypothetical protein [Paenibacillus sabuli]MBD2845584.1 hypothetical protein [Paenibacillus sabuli]
MRIYMKQGWSLTLRHMPVVLLLFLYQLVWGFFLYRFVSAAVVPLLKRYPDALASAGSVQLFFAEAEFRLLKTDLAAPYLWMLGGMLALRLLLTPLLQAGLLYSLRHADTERGTAFLLGIRRAWRPITLLYWLKTALMLAPGWWLVPPLARALAGGGATVQQLAMQALPYALGWATWAIVVHLLVLALQFGAVARTGWGSAMLIALRHFFPLALLSLILWTIAAGLSLSASALSLLWAGLLALLLHQAGYLARTLIKVWILAAQYAAWRGQGPPAAE